MKSLTKSLILLILISLSIEAISSENYQNTISSAIENSQSSNSKNPLYSVYDLEINWPSLCTNPDSLYNEQWPNSLENVVLQIENCGEGTLAYNFPDFVSGNKFACNNQLALYDTYGDGWNGGSLDVLVNGNLVLDNITLANGSGPEYFSFPVENGDDISTIYTAGNYPDENYYEFLDDAGNVIYAAGNESVFQGIVFGICPHPDFIVDVEPAMGEVPEGETTDITITYNSSDFPEGVYDEWLQIHTNDSMHYEDSIKNEMLIYVPGLFYGTITSSGTGLPLPGVEVSVGNSSTQTNDIGYYELFVDQDIYDVQFEKVGYVDIVILDTAALPFPGTEISLSMNPIPFPVSWVMAYPNDTDTECLVTWSLPMGMYEIIYDDNDADDFVIWLNPGNHSGVRFTPEGYPATICGAEINVGDGSFPAGANFIGSQFGVYVFDDDGVDGMPGTALDSTIIAVNNYGWVVFSNVFNLTIDSGDFYIVLEQLSNSDSSAPLAIDTDIPTVYRSVVKLDGSNWNISPYQDFMIRSYVYGPNNNLKDESKSKKFVHVPKIKEGPFLATSLPDVSNGYVKNGKIRYVDKNHNDRSITDYTVALLSDFDPLIGPMYGTMDSLVNTVGFEHNDVQFGGYDEGFYAYAVRTNYTTGQSNWVCSNIVGHQNFNTVTIVVTLCDDDNPDSSLVYLVGMDYPFQSFDGYCDSTGMIVFEHVFDGTYDLGIFKPGYDPYSFNIGNPSIVISSDTTIGGELIQKMYPVTNLQIDSLTSIATWENPRITQLFNEGFEEEQFPPQGWQATAIGAGWQRTDYSLCIDYIVPPHDGYYALDNDCGSSACSEDYLITPLVDLRESDSFSLFFDSYYTGAYGFTASVEYSYDNGTTWEILEFLDPAIEWETTQIDLSAFSGTGSVPFLLAFHGDDNFEWSTGWAIDNVEIKNGAAGHLGCYVFVNDELYGQTPPDTSSIMINGIQYGDENELCVQAIYECGASDPTCTQWQSYYLFPPNNFHHSYTYGTDEIELKWTIPITFDSIIPDGLISFGIYRDSILIADVAYENQGITDTLTYLDDNVEPHNYDYWISAIYDLSSFGYPGDIAESIWAGPEEISVVWGINIPFIETWGSGLFTTNNWTINQNSENWHINTQGGNPLPAAEFTWDPLLENGYYSELISYSIIVDYLTEGSFYLEFDIELINRNSTGNEKMIVEICGVDSCYNIAEFSNIENKGFVHQQIDITDYLSDNAIRIKFVATGDNSFDIQSWIIDNIQVYRDCTPPENLTGDYIFQSGEYIGVLEWNAEDIINNLNLVGKTKDSVFGNSTINFYLYRYVYPPSSIYVLYDSIPFYTSTTEYQYSDSLVDPYYITYCYKVTAHYYSETDECESSPAVCMDNTNDDYFCNMLEGINEQILDNSILVFPNPARSTISIISSLPVKEIEFVSVIGETVMKNNYDLLHKINVPVSKLKPGVYFVKIVSKNKTDIKKVVIR